MDTIFALATAPGRAGVAIIRISGSDADKAGRILCGDIPTNRGVRSLFDPVSGELIDEALLLWFHNGQSFTGEPVLELHLHGSISVTSKVLKCLSKIEGLRLAEAGEFTRRALENGKLDLAEVEGLADLIDAETEAQHRQAIRVFSGELGKLVESWRKDLIRAAALIEASIDFAEEDVPENVVPEVLQLVERLIAQMSLQIDGVRAAERIRDGFEVAIVGRPNIGKSTLLNHLAGRKAALISDIPGTTRDVIEVRMNIGGHAVTLLDTAGVREADDVVERLGIDLAKSRAEAADLRVFLIEAGESPVLPPRPNDIVVIGKSDLISTEGMSVSGLTGSGVDDLLAKIEVVLSGMVAGAQLAIRERHKIALNAARSSLFIVKENLSNEAILDLAADELRFSMSRVVSIVGHIDVEDLLDDIFSSFCIGK